MKAFVYLVLLIVACSATLIVAQQPQPKSQPAPQGKVLTVPAKNLYKFKDPIKSPPTTQPPKKDGGNWHWHPHHGWVWLGVGTVALPLILPVNYALPASVTVYEVNAAPMVSSPLRIQVVCPHCGWPVTVQYP